VRAVHFFIGASLFAGAAAGSRTPELNPEEGTSSGRGDLDQQDRVEEVERGRSVDSMTGDPGAESDRLRLEREDRKGTSLDVDWADRLDDRLFEGSSAVVHAMEAGAGEVPGIRFRSGEVIAASTTVFRGTWDRGRGVARQVRAVGAAAAFEGSGDRSERQRQDERDRRVPHT
jgi:hypothetical protein